MDSQPTIFGSTVPLFEGEQRFQRPKRAMELAGFSKSTMYRLLRSGEIKARKLGRMTLVDMNSIAELFERCPEITPRKIIDARTLSASQLGMDEPPDLPAPPDPDGGLLPAFRLTASDLDGLASPASAAKDDGG
jgi:predicted DNA-binding transcriptional regulator AlpA